MRVRCLRVLDPASGEPGGQSGSISVGGEYIVIEIIASPGRYVELRLHQIEGAPSLWPSAMFETTDDSIPSNWRAEVSDSGFMSVRPGRWRRGFWERYFNDDPEAVALYEEELATMLTESR